MILPLVGEGACFGINAASYLAVIVALLAMQVPPRSVPNPDGRMLDGVREGFAYARKSAPIRTIILLLAVVSLVGMPYTVLMPVFAREILHGDARTLGFLMSASGIGALTGALYLASRHSVVGLGRVIALATATFGIGLVLFSMSSILWLSLMLLIIVGFGGILQMASCNTIVQTIVDEDKRGRVMGIYIMAFAGTAPVGSLLAGALASRIGVSATLQLGGGICFLAALFFASRLPALTEATRPIYIRLGILPAKK
jgi:predicted MFS family arabinose efflux permease